jgi:hypothetical protein
VWVCWSLCVGFFSEYFIPVLIAHYIWNVQYAWSTNLISHPHSIKWKYLGQECFVFQIVNPSNTELNPIYHLLALLGAHHILHVSRIRVNLIWVLCCPLVLNPTTALFLATISWFHFKFQRAEALNNMCWHWEVVGEKQITGPCGMYIGAFLYISGHRHHTKELI